MTKIYMGQSQNSHFSMNDALDYQWSNSYFRKLLILYWSNSLYQNNSETSLQLQPVILLTGFFKWIPFF